MKRFGKKWFNLNVNKSTRNSADLFNSTTSESSHYDVCSWCMSLMYVVHLQKIWIKAMWFHNCHKCVQLVFYLKVIEFCSAYDWSDSFMTLIGNSQVVDVRSPRRSETKATTSATTWRARTYLSNQGSSYNIVSVALFVYLCIGASLKILSFKFVSLLI